jgi:Uma2 family endonuclease
MASSEAQAPSLSAALFDIRLPDIYGYTVADLHALPDDGRRWELIDGSLIVSPSATIDHNTIGLWIANALWDTNPAADFVIGTDQSATIDDHNEARPDVIVAPAGCFQQTPFPMAGARLVVEVVSPTSALRDTEIKRALYARAGVPAYWIVVPDRTEPTISLAELVLDESDGRYRYATHYTTDVFETAVPWPVRIDLPALSAKRGRMLRQSAEPA